MEVIGLRYFNVFGPRQDPNGAYAAVIPIFFKAALSDRSPTINGDGSITRDFTYIDNVVDINIKALFSGDPHVFGCAYNVVMGKAQKTEAETLTTNKIDKQMETKQQKETLNYFEAFAKDWKEKALGLKRAHVNVINQRNSYVLEVIKTRSVNAQTLDVGCGTGELVHEIAKLNIHAIGVDFSTEMIRLATEIAAKENIKKAEFVCSSIFDFSIHNDSFDVISANGFIEYISHEQFDLFLTNSFKSLKKNGSLVLGSRNRLFNMFSINQFTLNEIANKHSEKLLNEAIKLTTLDDPSDLLQIDSAPLETSDKTHSNTGIDVSTRYQYTPAQLVKMLASKGFEVKAFCPIHIHGVIPSFITNHEDVHFNISNLLSQVSNKDKESRNKLIPFSSSFMIHATKM